MTWIPPRTEDIASPLNPFYNLTNSEVQQVNPELSKKLKESKMNRKEHLDLNEAIANVWTGGQQDIQEGEELITEEMLVEELTNDITTVVESIQEEVGFELSEDEIVNEVARRVAKRIVEAKRAHKRMNEALGRKK